MKVIYEATVKYVIDDVESFDEAKSVYRHCVQADSAIDGVTLLSITEPSCNEVPDQDDLDAQYNKWEAQYVLCPNHLNPDASWNGNLFETYGEEQDYVYDHDFFKVWTYMDVDGGTAVVAGRHFINRIGYLITEKPWTNDEMIIWVSTDDSDFDEGIVEEEDL